jgi:tRNA pseudouridine55 synthase
MDGVLVIDKPVGPTSHDVVSRVRKAIRERRVGHTGTLDPAASGVLPLVLGRATRLARFLSAADKSYDAVIQLGISTRTGDAEGERLGAEYAGPAPSLDAVDTAVSAFRGTFPQQPPAFSAKKIGGRRSYKIARASARAAASGGDGYPAGPLPSAVEVTAHRIEVRGIDGNVLALKLICSAGFYVRALAHDLGERLGTGGHLIGLRRTASGEFTLMQAVTLDLVERNPRGALASIIPLSRLLQGFSAVTLTAEGAKHARHGRDLGPNDFASNRSSPAQNWIRLLDPGGELLGIARPNAESGSLHPAVVLI